MLLFHPKHTTPFLLALGFSSWATGCLEPKFEVDPNYDKRSSTGTSLGGMSSTGRSTGGTWATGGDTSSSASGLGGTLNTGGRTSTLSVAAGGQLTGGIASTGGSKSGGGTSDPGGRGSTGGTTPTGGQSPGGGAATGGAVGSGGVQSIGGNASTGGNANTGGTSAVPPPACLGNPLPIPANGWVAANSNGCSMVGAWYWFKDAPASGSTLETNVTSPGVNVTPAVANGGKACIAGHTVVDATFGSWGAGIGLDFNSPTGSEHQAYDYTSRDIGGFEVTISGSFPQGMKVQFAKPLVGTNEGVPFVSVARPGTYRVRFGDAFVPWSWSSTTNKGEGVDPAQVAALQFVVNGSTLDSDFSFCVESVIPLPVNDDGSMGNRPVKFVNLPLETTGTITAGSNSLGIQGLFTCVAASGYPVTCGSSMTSTNPYRSSIGGMCLSGMTTTASDNWGALINLTLNQASATESPASYNGALHKLRGFRIDTTNTSTGFPVQLKVSSSLTLSDKIIAPFEEFAQPGQHLTDIGSAACPHWDGTTCNLADPSSLYMIQAQLSPLNVERSFDLCIMKLEAMVER